MVIRRVVYIPSRKRTHNLKKIIPRWLDQGYEIRLVTEESDHQPYIDTAAHLPGKWNLDGVKFLILPENGKGIGYARNYVVAHAEKTKLKSFIMADDDVMPKPLEEFWLHDMRRLQKAVEDQDGVPLGASFVSLVGCAAVHSYQDFLFGGWLKKELEQKPGHSELRSYHPQVAGKPFLVPNGSCGQCYAVNVERAIKIGGYDLDLTVGYEDNDFMMRSITHHMPWSAHSGVWMDRLGGRFTPGGIADLTDIKENMDGDIIVDSTKYSQTLFKCRKRMAEKWPDYTSDPYGKSFRISWKKLYDGQIPSWRSLSAMHGNGLK